MSWGEKKGGGVMGEGGVGGGEEGGLDGGRTVYTAGVFRVMRIVVVPVQA